MGTGGAGANSGQVFSLPSTCLKEFRKGACTRRRGITRDNPETHLPDSANPATRTAALPVICESPAGPWEPQTCPAAQLRMASMPRAGSAARFFVGSSYYEIISFFVPVNLFITGDSQPRYFLIVIKIHYLLSF